MFKVSKSLKKMKIVRDKEAGKKALKKGLTLTEALMAVVILGIATAGVVLPFAGGAAVQAEGKNRTLAAKLAMDLMERIVKMPFDSIVSTYNGYTEPKGQIKDADGLVINDPIYGNFARTSSCEYVYVGQESGAAPSKYILATVKVYYRGNQTAQIKRLITK